MKKLIVLAFFVPFAMGAKAQFTITNNSTLDLVELRQGENWPINLQRVIRETDTTFLLQFRDQQYTKDVVMATLKFKDAQQLRYFQQGLSALRKGNTGDIAKYKEYTIKRVDVGKEGTQYTIICEAGATTNIKQAEADKMIQAIQHI